MAFNEKRFRGCLAVLKRVELIQKAQMCAGFNGIKDIRTRAGLNRNLGIRPGDENFPHRTIKNIHKLQFKWIGQILEVADRASDEYLRFGKVNDLHRSWMDFYGACECYVRTHRAGNEDIFDDVAINGSLRNLREEHDETIPIGQMEFAFSGGMGGPGDPRYDRMDWAARGKKFY